MSTSQVKTTPVPTLGVPAAPPLPEDLEALLRRLRLPHIRRHAPEVVATAKATHLWPDSDDRTREAVDLVLADFLADSVRTEALP